MRCDGLWCEKLRILEQFTNIVFNGTVLHKLDMQNVKDNTLNIQNEHKHGNYK